MPLITSLRDSRQGGRGVHSISFDVVMTVNRQAQLYLGPSAGNVVRIWIVLRHITRFIRAQVDVPDPELLVPIEYRSTDPGPESPVVTRSISLASRSTAYCGVP